FRPTKPVFNSIKKCRANFQNDELDTKAFIIKTKAEKNLTSTVTNFLAGIIELPQINVTYDGVDFVCPGSSSIGSLQAYTSFFSQVGTFIPITGLLFTIAVYGTKSIFGIMTTCLLDDIVILTTSFGPILWWYTYTKPLWYYGVIHEIKEDLIYDKDLINSIAIGIFFGSMELRLTNKEFFTAFKAMFIWGYFLHSIEVIVYIVTYHFPNLEKYVFCITGKKRHYNGFVLFNTTLTIVLTRSIASFFSDNGVIECTYKHGGDEKVYAEIKVKNINEILVYKYDEEKHIKDLLKDKKFQNIRRFFLNVKKYLFGKGVFESGPILEEIKKITGAEETCPLKHHNCERIKEAMKKRIKCRKKKTKKVKGEKENNDGPITIEVKRMRAENMVRINILETGALNYFIYSHRKDSEEEDKQKVQKRSSIKNAKKERFFSANITSSSLMIAFIALIFIHTFHDLGLDGYYFDVQY
ncbi:4182_t:CDS:2, partial [Entrophospora sp. SA101]